jgi:hypothetical protein
MVVESNHDLSLLISVRATPILLAKEYGLDVGPKRQDLLLHLVFSLVQPHKPLGGLDEILNERTVSPTL